MSFTIYSYNIWQWSVVFVCNPIDIYKISNILFFLYQNQVMSKLQRTLSSKLNSDKIANKFYNHYIEYLLVLIIKAVIT